MVEFREEEGMSRSARKRAAQAVEELARRLAELPEAQLRKLPADAEIVAELKGIRAIRSLPARDRQIRHLAAVLRHREEAIHELETFVAGLDRRHHEEQELFHRLEQWRDRLCNSHDCPQALQDVARLLPQADISLLARLARSAQGGDRHAAREIFRHLRRAAEA